MYIPHFHERSKKRNKKNINSISRAKQQNGKTPYYILSIF